MLDHLYITREIMEAILKVIDEGIHVVDTKGNTIFYNEVAARHDGMKVKEVLGKPLLEVFPSLTKESSTLLQVIATGKPIFHKGQTYVNVHGKTIDTINTTLPIFVSGKLVGAVEVAKDYSKLRKIAERLIDLESIYKNPNKNNENHNGAKYSFDSIITKDPVFLETIAKGKKAALSSSPVLVYGESGTGKELFVQGMHNASLRRKKPFIAQNCAALPESLLESILFGTAKGSYTGAVDRPGLFELASGGTLFLDELQSMPIQLQSKLLRVIEDGLVRRIGGTKSISVDVRLTAAMNIQPQVALKNQILRHDLYYRLNVLSFELPPLRERKQDIMLLTNHFIEKYNNLLKMNVLGIEKEVEELFLSLEWKGNVRELKHTIEFMMNVVEGSRLTYADLPVFIQKRKILSESVGTIPPLREVLKKTEAQLIQAALESTNGNILKAAKLLQIPRQTLQYKLSKYNL